MGTSPQGSWRTGERTRSSSASRTTARRRRRGPASRSRYRQGSRSSEELSSQTGFPCTGTHRIVCSLDEVAAGASTAVHLSIRATSLGRRNLLAQVSADRDADPSNDAASATLDVIQPRPTATRRCVVPWLTGKPALKAAAICSSARAALSVTSPAVEQRGSAPDASSPSPRDGVARSTPGARSISSSPAETALPPRAHGGWRPTSAAATASRPYWRRTRRGAGPIRERARREFP